MTTTSHEKNSRMVFIAPVAPVTVAQDAEEFVIFRFPRFPMDHSIAAAAEAHQNKKESTENRARGV